MFQQYWQHENIKDKKDASVDVANRKQKQHKECQKRWDTAWPMKSGAHFYFSCSQILMNWPFICCFFQRGCRTEVLVSVKTSGYNPGAGICSIVSLANIFPQGTKGGLQWLPSHVLASRPQSLLDPSPIIAWPCHSLLHSDRDKGRQRGTLPLARVLRIEQGL